MWEILQLLQSTIEPMREAIEQQIVYKLLKGTQRKYCNRQTTKRNNVQV